MTICYPLCTHKKDGSGSLLHRGNPENASIATYLTELPAIGFSTKWLLLSFRASLEPHWHMHIKTFCSLDTPKRLIRRSETYNDHIVEHIILSFCAKVHCSHKQKRNWSDLTGMVNGHGSRLNGPQPFSCNPQTVILFILTMHMVTDQVVLREHCYNVARH